MVLHELKIRLQQHLSDGLVTIIGSGLSCAEGLPGMGELAKHLCAAIGPGLVGADVAAWAEIAPLIQAKGLEAALLEKAPSAELEATIATATAELIVERERTIITEVFAGTRTLRLTRLIAHLLKPSTGVPIVTTNYDRLVEIAAEEAELGVDTMFTGRFAGTLNERESRLSFCRDVTVKKSRAVYKFQPRALVCKPHGSLDWYLRNGKPVHYAGDLPGAQRLIITPGQNKFRNGYESPFDHHRNRANDAIDRASRFLILGYGFNDDHLETHLSPAIRNGKPTLLMARTLSITAEALATDHANVIALDCANQDGTDGTRVIIDKTYLSFPGIALWDLHSFISEVLEP
ncbi:SIR2 family protein [Acidithiobacillus ferriphilus]|uniref:SIR2 family protein n=1 Tax=Acidithiobacillus ferriphilus TaxID=1689834 RepID=UPI001C06D4A0|nr:SIR2 family protein [Acidithiobacillus ferriphilus]MBU2854952.1 SIR2 family protein [Acidithiobacillus ferriphilus]